MLQLKDKDCQNGLKKCDPVVQHLQETFFFLIYKDPYRLTVNGRRKIYLKTNQKKVRASVLILGSTDFKARKVIRDKERNCIMIKDSVV